MSAGQRQLTLDDDQLLALAKLLHTQTHASLSLALGNDREYRAYIQAVARVDAAAEDVVNDLPRRPYSPLSEAERAELAARWLATHGPKPHDSEEAR